MYADCSRTVRGHERVRERSGNTFAVSPDVVALTRWVGGWRLSTEDGRAACCPPTLNQIFVLAGGVGVCCPSDAIGANENGCF
jgi:hypothetical protein